MTERGKRINIAIDGPAGAGKSTIARLVARKLGYLYIDTGAMYRAVALAVIRSGTGIDQTERIGELTASLDIRLEPGPDGQIVYVNGEDVTQAIRSNEVSNLVPKVAAIRKVRQLLVQKQQAMAAGGGVVMDGRDIGSTVLPGAEVKIFLTAHLEERALRRYQELKHSDPSVTYEQVLKELSERDETDRTREVSPLTVADDAYVLDTTNLSIDEVVERIMERCRLALEQGAG